MPGRSGGVGPVGWYPERRWPRRERSAARPQGDQDGEDHGGGQEAQDGAARPPGRREGDREVGGPCRRLGGREGRRAPPGLATGGCLPTRRAPRRQAAGPVPSLGAGRAPGGQGSLRGAGAGSRRSLRGCSSRGGGGSGADAPARARLDGRASRLRPGPWVRTRCRAPRGQAPRAGDAHPRLPSAGGAQGPPGGAGGLDSRPGPRSASRRLPRLAGGPSAGRGLAWPGGAEDGPLRATAGTAGFPARAGGRRQARPRRPEGCAAELPDLWCPTSGGGPGPAGRGGAVPGEAARGAAESERRGRDDA